MTRRRCSGWPAAVRPCSPTSSARSRRRWRRARRRTGYGLTETHGIVTANSARFYLAKPESCGPVVPTLDAKLIDEAGDDLPARSRRRRPAVRSWFDRDQGLPEPAGGDGRGDPRRMVRHRRHRPHRRRRASCSSSTAPRTWCCAAVRTCTAPRSRRRSTSTTTSPRLRCSASRTTGWAKRSRPRSCSHPGSTLDETELRRFLAERIAKHKIPARIWFRTEQLPRNASGKFLKRELRSELIGD